MKRQEPPDIPPSPSPSMSDYIPELFGPPFPEKPYVALSSEDYQIIQERVSKLNKISLPNDRSVISGADQIGVEGEYSFAKFYGLEFDIQIGESDGGYDYEISHIPTGRTGTCDVKTITFQNGDMLIHEENSLSAEVYFLVEKRYYLFGFIGVASRTMVKSADIHDAGEYSPARVRRIPRNELQSAPSPDEVKPAND